MTPEGDQLSVELHVPSALDDDLERDLDEVGATDVQIKREDRPGIAPILIVAAAVLGVSAVGELILRWRDKTRCQQTIDARGDKIKTTVNCDIKDGRIIVVSKDGESVEIVEAPKGIDLTEVLKAAVSGGGGAVKQAAEAAGATTE